ncbi:YqhG family protein [Sporolactobacillus sp. CQH2019]|uniref:YqhG family protein n=1 Tax=Sporolactobacillus sp. CQH2019 TaxID=3023512 RepID=UPI002367E6F1|nr:YqhG family protein [Sporolactobacillus sp. CQH2019]MDD9149278.1 YqhG family protein [Sporolactobacillus sp. CQH2019]
MQQAAMLEYLARFFTVSGCTLLPVPDDSAVVLKVKLTEEMDKLLMNRPFYWHYIEQIGGTPETATLVFRTDDRSEEGELIYFGSPRLHQIFDAAKKLAPYIRLYQDLPPQSSSALEPWLGINTKISYTCDLKKDRICSIGLQLINGTLIDGFQDILDKLPLLAKLPDYCYTLSPLIKIESGIKRIETFIESTLKNEPTGWADSAGKRWARDQELLDSFYEQEDSKPETYFQEKEAIREQYQPRILVQFINAGLFYLHSSTFLPGPIKDR